MISPFKRMRLNGLMDVWTPWTIEMLPGLSPREFRTVSSPN